MATGIFDCAEVGSPPSILTVTISSYSGSRLDAMDCLEVAAAYGLSLFALDFAGAGHSEGDYISLGFHEQNDVETVMEHLLSSQKISRICLWGRSMGAATSVLFAARNRSPELSCLILDSPFASLKEIASEVHISWCLFPFRHPYSQLLPGGRVCGTRPSPCARLECRPLWPFVRSTDNKKPSEIRYPQGRTHRRRFQVHSPCHLLPRIRRYLHRPSSLFRYLRCLWWTKGLVLHIGLIAL
jgi:pimeloyl-ACP methyl ester carboxylesterase